MNNVSKHNFSLVFGNSFLYHLHCAWSSLALYCMQNQR